MFQHLGRPAYVRALFGGYGGDYSGKSGEVSTVGWREYLTKFAIQATVTPGGSHGHHERLAARPDEEMGRSPDQDRTLCQRQRLRPRPHPPRPGRRDPARPDPTPDHRRPGKRCRRRLLDGIPARGTRPRGMKPYRVSNEARADIRDIGRFTQKRWGKPQRRKYLDGLDACLRTLAQNPKLAPERKEYEPPVRMYSYGRHVVVYVERGYSFFGFFTKGWTSRFTLRNSMECCRKSFVIFPCIP